MNDIKYWHIKSHGENIRKLTDEEFTKFNAGDTIQEHYHFYLCHSCGEYFYYTPFSKVQCSACKRWGKPINHKYEQEYKEYLKTEGHLIDISCIHYGIKKIGEQMVYFQLG